MKALRLTEEQLQVLLARPKASATHVDARAPSLPKTPVKRSKHRSVRVGRFDSKLEARIWADLVARQAAGEIMNLRHHVKFSLFRPGGEHVRTYEADFVYETVRGSNRIVADAKSPHTRNLPGWKETKALMLHCHNIEVLELP